MILLKRGSVFFLFLMLTVVANAQTTIKQQPVTDSVAKAMCGCITAYKDSITTRQQLFAVLQSCLQKNAAAKMDLLLNEDGFVQTDDRKTRADAMREVGRKIGIKVVASCDDVKALVKKFNEDTPPKELH